MLAGAVASVGCTWHGAGLRAAAGGVPVEMVLPWMVHLEVPFRSEDPGSGESDIQPFTCGGTLISPTLVLTAGHCVDQTGSLDYLEAITVTQAPGVQMFLPFNVWPSANSRAEFSGAPTIAGTYHVIVTATDASTPAVSSSVDFVWNVH